MAEYNLNEDVLVDKLGWCGCHDSTVLEAFQAVLNDLLMCEEKRLKETDEEDQVDGWYTATAERTRLSPVLVQIILFEFDRLGITEHGTSVRGSWIGDHEKLKELCSEPVESKDKE